MQPIWDKENLLFITLFIGAIIVVYFTPFIINQLFFILILIYSLKSKNEYFWIAFFFLLNDAPGSLFIGGDRYDFHRLAFFPLATGISINLSELFLSSYLLKSIYYSKKSDFIFKKELSFLVIYTIFIIFYSSVLGMSKNTMVETFRLLIPYSLFYIIPKLIVNETSFDNIAKLLFPFVFIALGTQMFAYITGQEIGLLLKGSSSRQDLLLLSISSKDAMRAAASNVILIYCFMQALYFLYNKKQKLRKGYLYLIIFTSSLSIFLSATRSWVLAFIFILLMLFFSFRFSKVKIFFRIAFVTAALIYLFTIFYPLITVQIRNAAERLFTVVSVAEGDLTADGTLLRLTERGPRVFEKVKESPIIGWGFSNTYFDYKDLHVGHHSTLLNVGIIGYILLHFIYLKWYITIFRVSKLPAIEDLYGRNTIKIFAFTYLSQFIIHSTAVQSWIFDMSLTKVIFYVLILSFISIIYHNSLLNN